MENTNQRPNLFTSRVQNVGTIDPTKIRLRRDQLLIRDIPDPAEITVGSIIIPATAAEQMGGAGKDGLYRYGEVIACGPGESYIEMGLDTEGAVRRKLRTRECLACESCGRNEIDYGECRAGICGFCDGSGRIPITVPTSCRPGDIVVYDRRKHAEFYVNGERLTLCYEEQAVIGIVNGYPKGVKSHQEATTNG